MVLEDGDRLVTAPLWGYASPEEYYRRASPLSVIGNISLPALVIATSEDDPFVPIDGFRRVSWPSSVTCHVMPAPVGTWGTSRLASTLLSTGDG